ncbi:MAG: ABC transporter permease [bacterium]
MAIKRTNHKDLLIELIKVNFKLRYNNSVLGIVWVLLKPLLTFLILFVIFTAFRGGNPSLAYAANLILGIVIFTLFQEGIIFGMHALLDLSGIMLKINFPRRVALLSALSISGINFLINFAIVFVVIILTGHFPNLISFAYFLFVIGIFAILLYDAAMISSIWLVKVRDMENIVQVLMQLMFYASGVFYVINEIHSKMRIILYLNPVAVVIDTARQALFSSRIANVKFILGYLVIAFVFYYIGKYYFYKNIKHIAEDF